MSDEMGCRCLGTDLDCPCPEPATQEDGYCDACRANDCMVGGRQTRAAELRKLAPGMPDPDYWLARAERLEAPAPEVSA